MRKSYQKGGHTFSLILLSLLIGAKKTKKIRKYIKNLRKKTYRSNKTIYR